MRTTRAMLAAVSLAAVVLAGCARSEEPTAPAPAPATGATVPSTREPGAGAEAATTGGGAVKATVVRVRFAPTAARSLPRILDVTTVPDLPDRDGWLRLPDGAGTLVVRVEAADATRVRLDLTPTGTGTAPYGVVLDEDTTAGDGFTLTWRYRDEGLLAHLGIRATGPGGQVERSLNVYHDEPSHRAR